MTTIERVERVAIDSVTPDPENARHHTDRNLAAVTASLKRFGQQKPLVVDKNNVIIAGNGTHAAAKALGWPTIVVAFSNLEGEEARAYAIADNRSGELAAWDDDLLRKQLDSLAQSSAELLNAAGYAEEELRSLLERAPISVATMGAVEGGVSELPSGFSRSLEEYDSSQVRSLIFAYSASQYGLIVEALATIAEENSLESNADVLVYLLEKAGHAVTERLEADD